MITRHEVCREALDCNLYPAVRVSDPVTTVRIRPGVGDRRADRHLTAFAAWAQKQGCSAVVMPKGMETVPGYRLVIDIPAPDGMSLLAVMDGLDDPV